MTCAHEWRVEYVPVGECQKCRARQEEADAYRRGAEAMRKRCEELVKHNSHEDGIGMGSQRMERAIAALPVPEDEP